MNCLIPGENLKLLNKVIHTLSKIGDELHLEAGKDYLQFATVNMTKTAYAKYTLNWSFFATFNIENDNDEEDDKPLTCHLLTKSVVNLFRSKGPIERKVEHCQIQFDRDSNYVIFKLKYKRDLFVIHKLWLIDHDSVKVNYDSSDFPNRASASGTFLQDVVNNFQLNDSDMYMEVRKDRFVVRNYETRSESSATLRSQLKLSPIEFATYEIESECDIAVSFRLFRAAAHFCENHSLTANLSFDTGGRPFVFSINYPTFEANFVFSTLKPSSEAVSVLAVEDRNVLEDVDWDDDFDRDEDAVPESPERKKMRLVFARCFEDTMAASRMELGQLLVPASDSE